MAITPGLFGSMVCSFRTFLGAAWLEAHQHIMLFPLVFRWLPLWRRLFRGCRVCSSNRTHPHIYPSHFVHNCIFSMYFSSTCASFVFRQSSTNISNPTLLLPVPSLLYSLCFFAFHFHHCVIIICILNLPCSQLIVLSPLSHSAGMSDVKSAASSAVDNGYDVNLFVTAPPENLMCGICTNVGKDLVETPCGHIFCDVVCVTSHSVLSNDTFRPEFNMLWPL